MGSSCLRPAAWSACPARTWRRGVTAGSRARSLRRPARMPSAPTLGGDYSTAARGCDDLKLEVARNGVAKRVTCVTKCRSEQLGLMFRALRYDMRGRGARCPNLEKDDARKWSPSRKSGREE